MMETEMMGQFVSGIFAYVLSAPKVNKILGGTSPNFDGGWTSEALIKEGRSDLLFEGEFSAVMKNSGAWFTRPDQEKWGASLDRSKYTLH